MTNLLLQLIITRELRFCVEVSSELLTRIDTNNSIQLGLKVVTVK